MRRNGGHCRQRLEKFIDRVELRIGRFICRSILYEAVHFSNIVTRHALRAAKRARPSAPVLSTRGSGCVGKKIHSDRLLKCPPSWYYVACPLPEVRDSSRGLAYIRSAMELAAENQRYRVVLALALLRVGESHRPMPR